MKVQFERSFAKDLKAVDDRTVLRRVQSLIEQLESSTRLQDIAQVKALEGERGYYRVRVGDYRLGIVLEGDTVILVRILHRKEIYRYFP